MRVDNYQPIVDLCRESGAAKALYYIARIQNRKELAVHINNGKTEEVTTGNLEGIGIQVFNAAGLMGFAATDRLTPENTRTLFDKAALMIEKGASYLDEPSLEFQKLTPLQKRIEIQMDHPQDQISPAAIEERLTVLNKEIAGIDPRLSVRTVLRIVDEEWRICRADGTDVLFNTPRAFIFHSITAKDAADTAAAYANISGKDLEILLLASSNERLQRRARKAADLALQLLTAPKIPSGKYKLVIDYALAKGLAHEAFGHAAETDNLESSILGENGRLKSGLQVASSKLSIIDGPLAGDYAYQPISAVGMERQTVTIVDHGTLIGGLADIFSAARAGVAPTGAERVESIFHLPIARMSNIRIEMEDAIPLEREFEAITPAELYRVLREHQLVKAEEKVLYLSGFQGGQVNPAFGDFVFHCSGIYELSENPRLFKPAIFSGKVLSVLQAVRAAIGSSQLDAMGTCGKMGQGVPSCGGSHYFLVIEQNPEILIGGE